MDYEKYYSEQKEAKKLETMTPTFHEWKEKGDGIIGSFVAKLEIPSKNNQGHYYQYIFDTNNGRIKFALGKVTDDAIAGELVKGDIYAITFHGKEDIGGGRSVNDFLVEHVGKPLPLTGDEIPF